MDTSVISLKKILSVPALERIEHWRSKYPAERKRPPIMAALMIAQEENNNYLTDEIMQSIAAYLEVPAMAVYEVATFYSMYHLKPVGEHVISVCTNLSCMLNGCQSIVEHLEGRLGISFGETTQDSKFTLKEVECMAACGGAPMLEVQKQYHEKLTNEKVDSILQELGLEIGDG